MLSFVISEITVTVSSKNVEFFYYRLHQHAFKWYMYFIYI